MTEKERLNERLEELYGRDTVYNKANFRIVWAPDEVETRETDTTEAGLFVENLRVVREMPKYGWLGNQWVVERLQPNQRPDVWGGAFIYEPLWAFPEGLPLNWNAVEVAVKAALKMLPPEMMKRMPRSQKEVDYAEEQKKKKEKEFIRNMLDTTCLGTALHDKNAMSYSNTKGIDYRPSMQKLREKIQKAREKETANE